MKLVGYSLTKYKGCQWELFEGTLGLGDINNRNGSSFPISSWDNQRSMGPREDPPGTGCFWLHVQAQLYCKRGDSAGLRARLIL